MKRFLMMLVLCTAVFSLRADDQAELKKICSDYHQFIINGTFDRILPFIHKEFQHKDSNGKTLDYAKVQRLAAVYRSWQKASKPTASLADIMEFAMFVQGQEFDSSMRKEFDAIEGTDKGKELKAQYQMMIGVAGMKLKAERAKMAAAWKTFKIISVTVQGNTAKLIYEMKDTETPKTERSEWDMVKVNGKWLIKKSFTKYL